MTPEELLEFYADRNNLTAGDVVYVKGLFVMVSEEAREAEREACAKVAEEWRWQGTTPDVIGWHPPAAKAIAAAIRARE